MGTYTKGDHYDRKRKLVIELEQLFEKNKGKKIGLPKLRAYVMLQYGIGKNALLNLMQPYIDQGMITIVEGEELIISETYKDLELTFEDL